VLGAELLLTGEVRYGRWHRTGGDLGALAGQDGERGMGKERIAGNERMISEVWR
jgi:hypothetical protein